ncbi:outer membrane beta-barrel protein [Lentilitoribacter sp. Alg239-R112]|uniref:outer membrane protein n=1 Tax=Lentilitoribacter sp. Alg239-R112 TaxID=2305987 RepID=UPI0013A6C90F|nr:outer membrane beta-barrel protein [Lentilitoribacter sp. Alg239-R112]
MRIHSKQIPATSMVIVSFLITSMTANAADLYLKEPDPVPVFEEPVDHLGFDWNRFYGGLNAGYIQGDLTMSTDFDAPNFNTSHSMNSAILGLTLGKNFRGENSDLLLGIEGDIGLMDFNVSETFDVAAGAALDDGASYRTKMDAFATLRGRLGFITGEEERNLLYITAGLSAARASASASGQTGDPFVTDSGWLTGYTIGGGIESAMNEKISLKLEYLYSDLTKDLNVTIPTPGAGGTGNVNFDFRSSHVVRVGLNVHF